jgi:hypothetical protein
MLIGFAASWSGCGPRTTDAPPGRAAVTYVADAWIVPVPPTEAGRAALRAGGGTRAVPAGRRVRDVYLISPADLAWLMKQARLAREAGPPGP